MIIKQKENPVSGPNTGSLPAGETSGNKQSLPEYEGADEKTNSDEKVKDKPPVANPASDSSINTATHEDTLNQSQVNNNELPPETLGDA